MPVIETEGRRRVRRGDGSEGMLADVVGSTRGSGPGLQDRHAERESLAQLIAQARGGLSGSLVLRGEAGVGKTALLDTLLGRAAGCRVVWAAGVESEMELAFASLHQLCAPFLDRLEHLPPPQRDALGTAFGLRHGEPPDRFLIGLATLSLLADVAESQPLVCLIDDAQWLDRASAQVLGFVARRLGAEAVVMVFAVRQPEDDGHLAGLPELAVGPLRDADARALLAVALPGRVDESVRDRIIAEARGNPLALLELPRAWTPAAFAGGFGLPDDVSVSGRIEQSFRQRLARFPDDCRRLLLLAAAEPVGDPVLVRAAAARLGLPMESAAQAIDAGFIELGTQVRFRHPLVRSVIYRDARREDRRLVHAALAESTDATLDPDRRAWHRAGAADGPDEGVAAELERSAGRAQARGGLAAAAAFLRRAVALTPDPGSRADRALAAAQASLGAGSFDHARQLMAAAEAGPLDALGLARVDLLRAELAFAQDRGGDAPTLLLQAAARLETLDVRLARDTLLDAWAAALFAGSLARGGGSREVSRAVARVSESAGPPRAHDLLLDGLALIFNEGRVAATPVLRRAIAAFAGPEATADELLRWGWLATRAANFVWDYDSCLEICLRTVRLARDTGALEALAVVDNACGQAAAFGGDFALAALLAAEVDAVKEATGTRIAPHAGLALAGIRGQEVQASRLIDAIMKDAIAGGQGAALQYARWAKSVLMNGLGRYEEALKAAVAASDDMPELSIAAWALSELIEAAARTEQAGIAEGALQRLGEHTAVGETDWGLGVYARSRALLSEGDAAERSYREAIERLGRTPLRPDLARAHLLYGEWLRRENRRVDARAALRSAHDLFVTIGMEAFAERARRELRATGEVVRKRSAETFDVLTAQELQIARLAGDGRTNPEIGAQLFLSPRTVEWHLGNVFSKLGVNSRRDLRTSLPDAALTAVTA
jgi:DNA-binding CsgD family transcriptional regulator